MHNIQATQILHLLEVFQLHLLSNLRVGANVEQVIDNYEFFRLPRAALCRLPYSVLNSVLRQLSVYKLSNLIEVVCCCFANLNAMLMSLLTR